MRREHRMLWLSATKPAVAIAVVQLWERGRIGLDDPVAATIPEFAAGGKDAITVRHLLTHTSGIRMLDTGWPQASWDAVIAKICARPIEPRWVPGRKAGYHLTSSWFVLAELVRRIDGRPIERYLEDELFGPLGMTSCSLGVPAARFESLRSELAPMYVRAGEGLGRSDLTSDAKLGSPLPGGNGIGPLRELARLYRMLANGGELEGRRLLSPQAVEAMCARHRVGLVDQTFKTKLDWGLGVIVDSKHYGDPNAPYGYGPHAGPRTYGHSGARSSVAFHDPDVGLVVALAVNGLPDEATHRARFERLTAAIYEDLGLATG
jgi:CubicO group peptidase (beta-lactamase class C family)